MYLLPQKLLNVSRDRVAPTIDDVYGWDLRIEARRSLLPLLVFTLAYYNGGGEFDARALAFTTLIISNLAMILTNRSWSRTIPEMIQAPNAALWWVLAGGLIFLGLVLHVPLLWHLFSFSFLYTNDWP